MKHTKDLRAIAARNLPLCTPRVALCLAVLLGALGTGACSSAPQPPPPIPFQPSSIEHHEDGSFHKGFLTVPTTIHGVPCRGWVRLHPDGRLSSYELAAATTIQGHTLPAATYVWLDDEGRLQTCFLSQATVIRGYSCRGGPFKTATAFHPDGGLRAFFPRDAVTIDGVPCAASSQAPVYLHRDGSLAGCRLAADVTRNGQTFRNGQVVRFDEAGGVVAR